MFRRPVYIFTLIILAGFLSACSHGPFSSSQVDKLDYKMASFYDDIPQPKAAAEVAVDKEPRKETTEVKKVPGGFRLQTFVDRIFYLRKKDSSKKTSNPEKLETASVKLPSESTPGMPKRDKVQEVFCRRIDQRLSSIQYQECMATRLSPTGHISVKGEPILSTVFPASSGEKADGRVLLIGGVHGDELSSVSIVFEWMKFLASSRDREFLWKVVPVMNPDGLFIKDATRTNANGVDLNRNMPTSDWDSLAQAYWRSKAGSSPRKFPGETPASEPETRWLIDEIEQYRPDMIIAVHAPHNLIDYDAPSRKYAPRKFGVLKGSLLGTYPGSLGNYAGVRRGIPVVTIELPSANVAISPSQARVMWSDMMQWLKKTLPLENERFKSKRRYAGGETEAVKLASVSPWNG